MAKKPSSGSTDKGRAAEERDQAIRKDVETKTPKQMEDKWRPRPGSNKPKN